jgi:Component of IIS longevity pathway SMK-1
VHTTNYLGLLQDDDVETRIARVHHTRYLKDVLLRPFLDELVAATLDSLIKFDSSEIVIALAQNGYVDKIFKHAYSANLPEVGKTCISYSLMPTTY